MQRCITRFTKELFDGDELPDATNRRFFPTPRDIRNHMYNAEQELKHSKIDQENLERIIEGWRRERPNDKFHFRGCKVKDGNGIKREKLWFNGNGIRIVITFNIFNNY